MIWHLDFGIHCGCKSSVECGRIIERFIINGFGYSNIYEQLRSWAVSNGPDSRIHSWAYGLIIPLKQVVLSDFILVIE